MLITEEKLIADYYQALLDRNSSYLGIFYVGVKTTSIFCIATCRARKPKLVNVNFYTTFKEALAAGYRPCKVCKPTQNAHQAPAQVEAAMALVSANPKQKISDYQLTQHNIRPELVRRWFNQHYHMTFHAFQRMYRINNAYQELQSGKNATDTAFDSGYESLSGFAYTYKKLLGNSPTQQSTKQFILINRFTTPLGPMFVCATERGICLLEFVDRKMLETELSDLQKKFNGQIIVGENKFSKQAKQEISEYFTGTRKIFNVSLDTPGSAFQLAVWQALQSVSYGQLSTYQQQAELLGCANAIRAVASANGGNRVSIIIPCHRVIAKNGDLCGYGGGLERKRWLLAHEKRFI